MLKPASNPEEFRTRGHEVSRLEAFSDAVFALAMTLLIVSGQVPTTFDDLVNVLRAFPAFAACFGILLWFWLNHYRFFRRYGLNDSVTIALNSCLLFLILFYVYPLKFVFNAFLGGLMGIPSRITFGQAPAVFTIYGAGFGLVWLLFALMHLHAYRLRDQLELNAVERLLTRAEIGRCLALIGIAVVSIIIARFGSGFGLVAAGWFYAATGPVEGIHGWSVSRRLRRLAATESAGQPSGTAHPPRG
jgi:uncharacterized membrane protein